MQNRLKVPKFNFRVKFDILKLYVLCLSSIKQFSMYNLVIYHAWNMFSNYFHYLSFAYILIRLFIWHSLLIFSYVQVKFGACYIMGQWGRAQNKINNAPTYFQELFQQFLFFFHNKIYLFIMIYALNTAYFLWRGNVS